MPYSNPPKVNHCGVAMSGAWSTLWGRVAAGHECCPAASRSTSFTRWDRNDILDLYVVTNLPLPTEVLPQMGVPAHEIPFW